MRGGRIRDELILFIKDLNRGGLINVLYRKRRRRDACDPTADPSVLILTFNLAPGVKGILYSFFRSTSFLLFFSNYPDL